MMDEGRWDTQVAEPLSPYLSPLGAWALSLGTSIGWGMLIVTANSYLTEAGPVGSALGLVCSLLMMLVIAGCYHFLIRSRPSSGGVYAYARDLFSYDHGSLVAWFLLLVYLSLYWANATSIPLFAQVFVGDALHFGFRYTCLGYDVYCGEVLLTFGIVILAGALCTHFRRGTSHVTICLCLVIVLGISICFGVALANHEDACSFAPLFGPDKSPLVQVANVVALSTWAFIGFESISYSVEEFAFKRKRIFVVLAASLITAAALYVLVMVLSISYYPEGYDGWPAYLGDLSSNDVFASIPAFNAAHHYLGKPGVAILGAALLSLVLTSLIGNTVALSRLLHTIARDRILPRYLDGLATTNEHGVPEQAILAIILISLPIPLIGRTCIGWIVDIATLSTTLIYGFVSACAVRDGAQRKNPLERVLGIIGFAVMLLLGIWVLFEAVSRSDAMANESYLIFTVWSVLGFIVFRWLLDHDREQKLGKSIFAWLILLMLVLAMCAVWMAKISITATHHAFDQITAIEEQAMSLTSAERDAYLMECLDAINTTNAWGAIAIAVFCMFSFSIMLSNFTVVQKREQASREQADHADRLANTDPLTGVLSKHAYAKREFELNLAISADEKVRLAIAVCDVNGLKQVNDTLGHKAGDDCIRSAADMICRHFPSSEVFRIGGDEFCVLLQGVDYHDRERLLQAIDAESVTNKEKGRVVVACGLATMREGEDSEVHEVFERADARMYARKRELKEGEEVR